MRPMENRQHLPCWREVPSLRIGPRHMPAQHALRSPIGIQQQRHMTRKGPRSGAL